MSERVILCEGYYDRSFWAGALLSLGCSDPGALPDGTRKPVLAPDGKAVKGGDFGFLTPSNQFARIRPCGGREKVVPALRTILAGLATRPFDLVVVNIDDDGDARAGSEHAGFPEGVRSVVLGFDPNPTVAADGGLTVAGHTRVAATAWWTAEAHTTALPWKQTLERLVCAAVDGAYPGSGAGVGAWLAGAPSTDGPKAHAWSHMAGWYSEGGCDGFYRFVWSDPAVVTQLRSRLIACGAWQLMEAVAA